MDFTASKESLMLYKLIILFLLDKVSFPLTQSQVSEFILDKGYTDYLTLQQVLAELIENNLLTTSKSLHRTQLIITPEGRDTLGFFESRISDTIKQEIKDYLREHSLDLRNEISVVSDYYKNVQGEYDALISAKDRDTTLVEIKLSVPTPQMAEAICENWRERNQEVYEMLTKMLF